MGPYHETRKQPEGQNLTTDARWLRNVAYGSAEPLRARRALYALQSAGPSLATTLATTLSGVRGTVLDVGAGDGRLLRGALRPSARVVAADLSYGMLLTTGGIRVQASAEKLPFSDRVFSCVAALHVLYHVRSPEAALAEMLRVASTESRIVVSTNGPHHLTELRSMLTDVVRTTGEPDWVLPPAAHSRFSVAVASSLLAPLGFEHRRITGSIHIRDAAIVTAYVASCEGSLSKSLPRRVSMQDLLSLVRAYVAHVLLETGAWTLTSDCSLYTRIS
jgi:SAM-dependent methyltransferase